mgnify:CR=1 FL=1
MSGVIIKAGEARVLSRGLRSLDLRDIARQAEGLLDRARAEAAAIREAAGREAEAERELIRQTAHRRGYEEGLAQGREAGTAQALAEARQQFAEQQASLAAQLRAMLAGFGEQRERMYIAARRDVIVLAIAVARRLAGHLASWEAAANAAAAQACREALDLIGSATEATIRVHPADWQTVSMLSRELGEQMQIPGAVRVVEDETVGRGGVVVGTADSVVDGRAAARVERIADELVTDWRNRAAFLGLGEVERGPIGAEENKPEEPS